jgi:hypothetical protein
MKDIFLGFDLFDDIVEAIIRQLLVPHSLLPQPKVDLHGGGCALATHRRRDGFENDFRNIKRPRSVGIDPRKRMCAT